jgi:hypothetical protein
MTYLALAAVSFVLGAGSFAGLIYVGWIVERPTLMTE